MKPHYLLAAIFISLSAVAHEPHVCPDGFPEEPRMRRHIEQSDIISGAIDFTGVFLSGGELFKNIFNVCDGQGRPATTGLGDKRAPTQPDFIRTSGPDSSSCGDCHDRPKAGGAGRIATNAFDRAQDFDPVLETLSPEFSNERNTTSLFGIGAIDLLAREMSADLQDQAWELRDAPDGWYTLTTKDVDFDVRLQGGEVVEARGIDPDLIVKPFDQGGTEFSLRSFTVEAFNRHHGMQAEERYDLFLWDPDWDEDGVTRELTIGDITSVVVWQAALEIPVGLPAALRDGAGNRGDRASEIGMARFEEIGCADCHKPVMTLDDRVYCDPDPRNPEGIFSDTSQSYCFDLITLRRQPAGRRGGSHNVRAYTDLKRHNLCDPGGQPDAIRHFCNEQLAEGRPDQDGRPGSEFFLTARLWAVGNSEPYGHRGDLTTITEAILMHGGEARESRDAFVALPHEDQENIVYFLKGLVVLSALLGAEAADGEQPRAPSTR